MRSGIAIFLLVLVVLVQTPVGQLFKLPLLIEHFIKHQKQNNISFFDFLEDHYSPDHSDWDLPEDEQLPFKKIMYYSIGYAIVPRAMNTNVIVLLPVDKKISFPDTYAAQQHLASIFHPPKV